jgi:hypothetical protein
MRRLRFGIVPVLALLPLMIAGCEPPVWPKQPPEVDLTGVWQSKEWDLCYLTQSGADLSGKVGSYKVDGLVTGKDVYLFLFINRNRPDYTVKLDARSPGEMIGYYYYGLLDYDEMQPTSREIRNTTTFHKTSDVVPQKWIPTTNQPGSKIPFHSQRHHQIQPRYPPRSSRRSWVP